MNTRFTEFISRNDILFIGLLRLVVQNYRGCVAALMEFTHYDALMVVQ